MGRKTEVARQRADSRARWPISVEEAARRYGHVPTPLAAEPEIVPEVEDDGQSQARADEYDELLRLAARPLDA